MGRSYLPAQLETLLLRELQISLRLQGSISKRPPKYVQKICGEEFLVLDRKTDIREGTRKGDNASLTLIARFKSKKAAVDFYESPEL